MTKHLPKKNIVTSSSSVGEHTIIIKVHHTFKVEGGVQERIVAYEKGKGGGPGNYCKGEHELRA
jgi:hypothetical protein